MAPEGAVDAGLEHGDDGDDGEEDASKQLGHFLHGPQPNWLSSCTCLGVSHSDAKVTTIRPTSRTMPGRPTSVPAMLNTTGDFQKPLSSTSPTTAPAAQS